MINILLININPSLIRDLTSIDTKEEINVERYKSNSKISQPDIVLFGDNSLESANKVRFSFKKEIKFICLASPKHQAQLVKEEWITDIWDTDISDVLFKYKITKFINKFVEWKFYERNQIYLDAIINLSPDIIWFKDLYGNHMLVNDQFRKYTQKSNKEIIGKTHSDIWDGSDTVGKVCMDSDIIITTTGITKTFEEKLILKDNSVKDVLTYKAPLRDKFSSIVGSVGLAKDITLDIIKEKQLNYNATHDSLTGVLNRQAFQVELETKNPEHYAIIFFDLDNFKTMNDKYGHKFGDTVIKMFAGMLNTVFSEDIVGRYGGDEFIVACLNNEVSEAFLKQKFDILEAYLEQAKKGDGRLDVFGTSIGIAFGSTNKDFNKTISFADIAMYRAKQLHKAKNIKEDFGQKGVLYYLVNK